MDSGGESAQKRVRGATLLRRGLLVAARDEFEQWLSLVEASHDSAQIIPALNALFAVSRRREEWDLALGYVKRALSMAERDDAPPLERCKVYLNCMGIYTDLGQLDDALIFSEKAARARSESETVILDDVYWLNLSKLLWRRQDWPTLHEVASQFYEHHRETGSTITGVSLINLGVAELELGNFTAAEAKLKAALAVLPPHDLKHKATTQAELGRLHFRLGEYEEALVSGREALNALLTHIGGLDREEVARVSQLFGTIFAPFGQRNLALKYFNRSAAYFSQLGLRAEWRRSTDSIDELLSTPLRPTRTQLLPEVHQLDFLTALLDMTDDLESVDPYLRGHAERVASLAVILGRELGLPTDELVAVNHGARLADVGMIAVDVDLLQRVGPLSPAELQRVSLHATIGEEMLRPFGLGVQGLKGVRHHHEHYDGAGFPDGLQADEIPLIARIIAVADVYDSLTSDRPYRTAYSHVRACSEMEAMMGRKLDPHLVNSFLALFMV
jgi:HD-GYP domain-containing protein (c-di-GMP phosphodiesterase class II)